MMEVPKIVPTIVHDRLRASGPQGSGPKIRGRKRESEQFAAVSTTRQVFEDAVAFTRRKRLLDKCREHVRIGMSLRGCGWARPNTLQRGSPQAVIHDFGNFHHVRSVGLLSPVPWAGTFPSGNVFVPESCANRERKFN